MKQNAQDAKALALRGTVELHLGDEAKALADLRRAWAIEPAEETRSLLVSTLLEGMRTDPKRYLGQTEELRQLLKTPEERLQFLQQAAAGSNNPETRGVAFQEYLKLSVSFQGALELQELSSLHHARTDRWIKARINQLMAKASPEELAQWDESLAQALAAALPTLPPGARWNLLSCLPSLPSVERAELELIKDWRKDEQLLRKTLVLGRLRQSSNDGIASKSTLALAELYLGQGRNAEAYPLIEELGKKWPGDWREDFRALGAPEAVRWPDGKLQAKLQLRRVAVLPETPVEVECNARSPFARWTFSIDQQSRRLLARDENGDARWHLDLGETNAPILSFRNVKLFLEGHLAVLSLGTHFAVLDLLSRKHTADVLWSENLTDPALDPEMLFRMQRLRQNRIFVGGLPLAGESLGKVGLVNANAVVYQVGERLTAADPITGEPLWVRGDIRANSNIFGDLRHLAVVSPDETSAAIYRLSDGDLVRTAELPTPQDRISVRGLDLIVRNSTADGAMLACRNLLEEKPRWQIPCPTDAPFNRSVMTSWRSWLPMERSASFRLRMGNENSPRPSHPTKSENPFGCFRKPSATSY